MSRPHNPESWKDISTHYRQNGSLQRSVPTNWQNECCGGQARSQEKAERAELWRFISLPQVHQWDSAGERPEGFHWWHSPSTERNIRRRGKHYSPVATPFGEMSSGACLWCPILYTLILLGSSQGSRVLIALGEKGFVIESRPYIDARATGVVSLKRSVGWLENH